jgi:predicted unusual protein kinase regulating ubiquinone biosynthesis (AarF/ABC1/UbiB family)
MSDSIPTGRLGRLIQLAGVGARAGSALLVKQGAAGAARHAAEVLGNLRGLPTKIAQMASFVDGLLPEGQREVFQEAFARLQRAAPTSSPAAVRQVIERELEAPLDHLFTDFEETPFASASIGQVHRATLPTGEKVAVKVQHPGIETAIENDLASIGVVESLVGKIAPAGVDTHAVYEVIRSHFIRELDYEREAAATLAFRQAHAEDPGVQIPRVFLSHSRRRVLTTELLAGVSLERACEADGELRARYAAVLWRFVFRSLLVHRRFNADPHPGNYLFNPDGSVAFLDFGCISEVEAGPAELSQRAHWAAIERDEAGFRQWAARLLGTRSGSYERAALDYSRRCFEPLFASPFQITRAFVGELTERVSGLKREIWAKDSNFTPLPPNLVMLNRLQFGFYSVIARLDVSQDYAAVERAFLPRPEH